MIIKNGKIITWGDQNQIIEDKAVLIRDGFIIRLGSEKELIEQNPKEEILDAQNQYIMPGNICAHTHFYGAFSRGMAIPGNSPKDFPEILTKLWWPLDKALSLDDVYYSALVCIIDAIKHGTTTLFDHHASQTEIDGSLDKIREAVDLSGIRACLCYEVTDRDGEEKARKGINENVRFYNEIKKTNSSGRLKSTFGLHASLTLSDLTLEKSREVAPIEMGFHIHVAEHPSDQYDSIQKSGLRVVDRLKKHMILRENTIIGHAVHVDSKEVAILSECKSWVTHQPRSNMNNGVGVAEVESMLRSGIKVCLGNDGFSNTMWEEMKTAYLVHKLWNHDPRRMSGMDIIEMAINNNAALASQYYEHPLGMIKEGAIADLIFVDYQPITPMTTGNLPWHILFGFNESMVTTTIIDGKVLMRNRKLTTLDENEIANKARELAAKTWQRYNAIVKS